MTVTFTDSALVISVPTTISCTTTVVESAAVTEAATEIITASATVIVLTTQTQNILVIGSTGTVTSTVVETVTARPVETCGTPSGPFKAVAAQYSNMERFIYAHVTNGVTGSANWQPAATSTAPGTVNRYI